MELHQLKWDNEFLINYIMFIMGKFWKFIRNGKPTLLYKLHNGKIELKHCQ